MSTADQTAANVNLPGFYFDPIKKRYFRIPPSSENLFLGKVQATNVPCYKKYEPVETVKSYPIPGLLRRQELGNIQPVSYRHNLHDQLVRSLNCRGPMYLYEGSTDPYQQFDSVSCLEGCVDRSSLLGIWHVENKTNVVDIMTVSIKWEPTKEGQYGLRTRPSENYMYHLQDQVNHLCWAPISSDITCVLYTVTASNGCASYAWLRPLPDHCKSDDSDDLLHAYMEDFVLGNRAVWTCAWNEHQQLCSFGVEKHAFLMDMFQRRVELFTKKSSPLTQTFSENGQLLFHGTRRGDVICSDLRQWSHNQIAYEWSVGSSVVCLKLCKNETQMVTNAFKSKLQNWDVRMRRCLQKYPGQCNEYLKLPFCINEEDELLCAAGQDGFTRIWDLFDGRLLRKIPPPHPVNRDTIPLVTYGNRWAGKHGRPALILAVKGEIYIHELAS